MSRHSRTKLVPPKTEPKNQELETVNEFGVPGATRRIGIN